MLSFDKVLDIDTQRLSSSEKLFQYPWPQENKKENIKKRLRTQS